MDWLSSGLLLCSSLFRNPDLFAYPGELQSSRNGDGFMRRNEVFRVQAKTIEIGVSHDLYSGKYFWDVIACFGRQIAVFQQIPKGLEAAFVECPLNGVFTRIIGGKRQRPRSKLIVEQ